MSRDETAIENEIQAKGLNAPRLTPAQIDAQIVGETYIHANGRDQVKMLSAEFGPMVQEALGCLTICILVLANGFTVVGKSACASPANFDAMLGQKIAREDARNQIWALEGYRLRSNLMVQ